MPVDKEVLFKDSQMPILNTRQKRYNNIRFSSEVVEGKLVLKSEEGTLELSIFDEIVLQIICKFKFCPLWLAKQWYETQLSLINDDTSMIRKMIDYGLVYEFPSAVSVFLMPTNRLASLLGVELGAFTNPPYNTLTHTISEEQVLFECLSGQANYLGDAPKVPFVSSLGLGKLEEGCYTIPESDYSVRTKYFNDHIEEFNDQEAILASEMLQGKVITTPDLKQSKLTIHKKIDVDKYDIKVPDLAVLAPRKVVNGIAMPQSIALEVELTCKGINAYIDILELYWDNLRYGTVVYLVNDERTKGCLLEADKIVKARHQDEADSRTCKLLINEFVVPYDKSQMMM